MRLTNSSLVVLTTIIQLATCSCSSSKAKPTVTTSPNPPPGSDANADQTIGSFSAVLLSAFADNGVNPASTDVNGTVFNGPNPQPNDELALDPPADAMPGCVVYKGNPPNCSALNSCGAASTNAACAAAALTGNNICVCVDLDTCQPTPSKMNVGTVTVNGVASDAGVNSFQLLNLSNSYHVDTSATNLAYPGFAEGDPIKITATGGDYEPFELTAQGVAPLILTNEPYNLSKDPSDAGGTTYKELYITWRPPRIAGVTRVQVELNISRHGGNVGSLQCDVEDTGSVTISAGQISQLVALGSIGGFSELVLTRTFSSSTPTRLGNIEFNVESSDERFVTIDGYISCEQPSDCPSGQVCNGGVKLCMPQ